MAGSTTRAATTTTTRATTTGARRPATAPTATTTATPTATTTAAAQSLAPDRRRAIARLRPFDPVFAAPASALLTGLDQVATALESDALADVGDIRDALADAATAMRAGVRAQAETTDERRRAAVKASVDSRNARGFIAASPGEAPERAQARFDRSLVEAADARLLARVEGLGSIGSTMVTTLRAAKTLIARAKLAALKPATLLIDQAGQLTLANLREELEALGGAEIYSRYCDALEVGDERTELLIEAATRGFLTRLARAPAAPGKGDRDAAADRGTATKLLAAFAKRREQRLPKGLVTAQAVLERLLAIFTAGFGLNAAPGVMPLMTDEAFRRRFLSQGNPYRPSADGIELDLDWPVRWAFGGELRLPAWER